MNLPLTHYSNEIKALSEGRASDFDGLTHTLSLQVRASEAVVVLVTVRPH